MTRLLLLHGPNLDQLGRRDPAQYGMATLDDVVSAFAEAAGDDVEVLAEQHDAEADLVTRVHAARDDGTDGVVVNAGALTHYSHALRDALELLDAPVVELHLSHVHAREPFRRVSVLAPACDASIAGFGVDGYRLAARGVLALVARR